MRESVLLKTFNKCSGNKLKTQLTLKIYTAN